MLPRNPEMECLIHTYVMMCKTFVVYNQIPATDVQSTKVKKQNILRLASSSKTLLFLIIQYKFCKRSNSSKKIDTVLVRFQDLSPLGQ